MQEIRNDAPVFTLTVDQLKKIIDKIVSEKLDEKRIHKKYVTGLEGICKLFNVSGGTAIKYKQTFLKPAVHQRGRKIVVDVDMAIRLFNEYKFKNDN